LHFPLHAYLLAFTGAFLATLIATPLWRVLCQRRGWVDDPGHRKIHHTPVALAGGPAVFTGMVLVLLAGLVAVHGNWLGPDAVDKLSYGLGRRAVQLTAIFAGAAGMLALGAWDDLRELRPSVKLAGQLLIALLVAAAGVRVTLFVPSVVFSYAITVLWILTVTNALNFNDNMNGLCGGLGMIAALVFGLLAARNGQYLVASLAFLTAGALLGFLPYNFPRASVFLGDSGSHLVGFLLAVLAILPHFYSSKLAHPSRVAVLYPLFVLAVPLLDLASVVWIRTRAGKPFWIGDTQHFSHRLVRAGHSRPVAVLILWSAAAAGGFLAWL
jgi:UDP-GlcNAc:undecaprenyl-phosphate GlcNAc-1-phosphate transferase